MDWFGTMNLSSGLDLTDVCFAQDCQVLHIYQVSSDAGKTVFRLWEEKDVIIIWECHLTKVDVLNQLFCAMLPHRRELHPFKTQPGIMIFNSINKRKKA